MVNYVNYGSGCISNEYYGLQNMWTSKVNHAMAARNSALASCGGSVFGCGFNVPMSMPMGFGFGFGCPMPCFGFGFPGMGILGAYGCGYMMGSMIGQTIGLVVSLIKGIFKT